MKKKITLLFIILVAMQLASFSQEKTKKQLKAERKLELQKLTDSLMNARNFVFTARTALPQGFSAIDLTTNPNFVKFLPDSIHCDMPFFGSGYSGIGYGGDRGLEFSGKPQEYSITRNKKNYSVKAVLKTGHDTFQLFLTVSFEGSASLSINSMNRSPISYNGKIIPTDQFR